MAAAETLEQARVWEWSSVEDQDFDPRHSAQRLGLGVSEGIELAHVSALDQAAVYAAALASSSEGYLLEGADLSARPELDSLDEAHMGHAGDDSGYSLEH